MRRTKPPKRFRAPAIPWERMFSEAKRSQRRAYAPYSTFSVGAAVLTDDNRVIAGCNIENSSYGLSICAERCAVAQAIATGSKRIRAIAIVANVRQPCPPCGLCRQMLSEFADATLPIKSQDKSGRESTHTLEQLFPVPFGPSFL